MNFVHGGDIYSLRERFAGEVLDFSANNSPLGMPEAVSRAARRRWPAASITRTPPAGTDPGHCPARRGAAGGGALRQRRGGPDLPGSIGGAVPPGAADCPLLREYGGSGRSRL